MGVKFLSHCGFDRISLKTNDGERLFMCSLAICRSLVNLLLLMISFFFSNGLFALSLHIVILVVVLGFIVHILMTTFM